MPRGSAEHMFYSHLGLLAIAEGSLAIDPLAIERWIRVTS